MNSPRAELLAGADWPQPDARRARDQRRREPRLARDEVRGTGLPHDERLPGSADPAARHGDARVDPLEQHEAPRPAAPAHAPRAQLEAEAATSYGFTVRKGATTATMADTTLTCTVSGATGTSCSDTRHSVVCLSTDLVDLKMAPTGTPTDHINVSWLVKFVPS